MIYEHIITGIITYNPNLNILKQNIISIANQCSKIVIVDNASKNITAIKEFVKNYDKKIEIICNSTNRGIAEALNQAMNYGITQEYEWMLSLDQDSVCPDGYIEDMIHYFYVEDNIAIVAPLIIERNVGIVGHNPTNIYAIVRTCITSGAFTKISCWKEVGGYDVKMFIDSVDFEFCYRIRKSGYKVLQTSSVRLEHSLGEGRLVNFLWFKIRDNEHNAFRCFYIAQNNIYYPKKHKLWLHLIRGNFRNLKQLFMVILYEKDKTEKIQAIIRGWKSGYILKMGD